MKKVLLSLLFALPAMGQNGFRTEGNALVWERVYPAAGNNLTAILNSRPDLQVDAHLGNTFTGRGEDIQNTTCASQSALLRNNCKFDFTVQLNDGNYVVRVSNLKIIEKLGPMQARIVANRCEKYFMSAQGLRKDTRTSSDMACMDDFLSGLFGTGSVSGALTAN